VLRQKARRKCGNAFPLYPSTPSLSEIRWSTEQPAHLKVAEVGIPSDLTFDGRELPALTDVRLKKQMLAAQAERLYIRAS